MSSSSPRRSPRRPTSPAAAGPSSPKGKRKATSPVHSPSNSSKKVSRSDAHADVKSSSSSASSSLPAYTFNVNKCLDKKYETSSFNAIIKLPPSALEGLAAHADAELSKFGVHTIADIPKWKFYRIARALVHLVEVEEDGKRDPTSVMNMNGALDKEYELKSLHEIVKSPVNCLQGIGPKHTETLALLHIDTVEKLGNWKFGAWAQALVDLAEFEHLDHSS